MNRCFDFVVSFISFVLPHIVDCNNDRVAAVAASEIALDAGDDCVCVCDIDEQLTVRQIGAKRCDVVKIKRARLYNVCIL
mgnify:CR=1 FL=1